MNCKLDNPIRSPLTTEPLSCILTPEERAIGKENFYAAIGSKPIRRDLLKKAIKTEVASGNGLGPMYFGYGDSVAEPVRVGVIGTGDEGSVLLGAINPEVHRGQGDRRHPPVQRVAGLQRRLLQRRRPTRPGRA